MVASKDSKFGINLARICVVLLLILSFAFFFLSDNLDFDFFLRFSADKELSDGTLSTIKSLQSALFSAGAFSIVLTFVFFFLRKRIGIFFDKHGKIIQNILLLVAVFAFVLFLGEMVANFAHNKNPLIYSIGMEGFSFNFPEDILNNEGVRDKDYLITKPGNTKRIIVLGDSYTFGSGVENKSDTYPKVLERKLNSEELVYNYEVLNFGISGLDSRREIEILKERALKYDPDLIIVGFVINDLNNVDSEIKTYNRLRLPFVGFALSGSSYLYHFLEETINKAAHNFGRRTYEESLVEYYDSETNKAEFKIPFSELHEITEEEGIKAMIVVFPVFFKMNEYPFVNANNLMRSISLEKDFYFLDMLEFYKVHAQEELEVSSYNSHPNEFAHNLAAEEIYRKLLEEGFVVQKSIS